ncbi:ABC transporter substrate-binding protein [Breznakiella homolactica]|uniref:Extracellular solute-binding protein n=1 Tax=Breznakiella homolactica TaxID=2798577 RepID=A0A7T7XNS7_9SPIR|nr:extracellular solute-binding protein [Breznakiella homolactica]QQO09744.1 extracellular solute-binding protein [Breznakiella homolactica]
MKKRMLLAVLAAAAVISVFAGGKSDDGTAAGGPVTLSVYMQLDLADPRYAYWPETVAAFEAQHPEIKLDFEYVADEQFHDKFQTMAAAGAIPDVFTCYAGARSNYILDRGAVKDLRPYLTDAFKANYNAALWQPQGPNGEIYIISPNMAVCTEVYINTKLLRELNLTKAVTLEEMIAQVPAIRAAGYTPLMFANKGQWQASSFLLSMLVHRMGGTAWFDKAMTGEAKFTDKPFVDALAIVKRMVDERLFPAGVNQMEGHEGWGEFVRGNAVYLLEAGYRIGAIQNAADPADFAQYEVMAFPAVPGEIIKGSSAATLGQALAMNKNLSGAKAEAAWKFLSFIYGPVGADIFVKHGNVSTYKLDYSKYNLDTLNRQYIGLIEDQPMGYVIDAKMNGEGVNRVLNPGIQAVMMGAKTPAQLAAEYEAWVAANDTNRKR